MIVKSCHESAESVKESAVQGPGPALIQNFVVPLIPNMVAACSAAIQLELGECRTETLVRLERDVVIIAAEETSQGPLAWRKIRHTGLDPTLFLPKGLFKGRNAFLNGL